MSETHQSEAPVPANLPTELLRSLVAIVEAGTMQRATERVFVTQSALSLQMRRLEEIVQKPLFVREGRRLILTPAGEVLLNYARRMLEWNDKAIAALSDGELRGPVRVGMVQDFAETLLPGVLARFAALHPQASLHVRVMGSHDLLESLATDKLDLALCVAPADDPQGVKIAPMRWIGAAVSPDEAPLALLERPCLFRDAALRALEGAGVRYRVVVETASLSALRAAVAAGLGVTCRTDLFLGGDLRVSDSELPPLANTAYTLHVSHRASSGVRQLAGLLRGALEEL